VARQISPGRVRRDREALEGESGAPVGLSGAPARSEGQIVRWRTHRAAWPASGACAPGCSGRGVTRDLVEVLGSSSSAHQDDGQGCGEGTLAGDPAGFQRRVLGAVLRLRSFSSRRSTRTPATSGLRRRRHPLRSLGESAREPTSFSTDARSIRTGWTPPSATSYRRDRRCLTGSSGALHSGKRTDL
jgi:hypothetical protein